jgi:2-C-methyl-D-erythritol 4-phosphate cytidylyltransferase
MHSWVIVVAAGSGTRIGGATAKAFVPLSGTPMLVYPLRTLTRLANVTALTLVVGSDYVGRAHEVVGRYGPWPVAIGVACGGAQRQDSVAAGLALVETPAELVVVHDAARPFVSLATAEACIAAAAAHGAAIVAVPARDTVKVADAGVIAQTLDRERIWLAQTPQVFRVAMLREAYAQARRERLVATDDAALVERLGASVRIVPGESANRKITTPDDLRWAEWYLAGRNAASAS